MKENGGEHLLVQEQGPKLIKLKEVGLVRQTHNQKTLNTRVV